jgi:hypothetical protein
MDHFLRGFANELIKTAAALPVGGTPASKGFNPFKTQKIPTQALQSPKGPPAPSNVRQRATKSNILRGAGKVDEVKVKKVKKNKVKKPLGDSSSIVPWETANQKADRIQTNMRTGFNKRKENQKAQIAKTRPEERTQQRSFKAGPTAHQTREQGAQQSFPKPRPVRQPQTPQQQVQQKARETSRATSIADAAKAKINSQKKWRRIQSNAAATKRALSGVHTSGIRQGSQASGGARNY